MKKFLFSTAALLLLTLTGCSSPKNENSHDSSEAVQSTTAFDKADISLTISCYGELPKVISNAVSKFNETDNGYTIEVRDYEQFVGEMPDKNDSNSEEKIAQARQQAYDKFYEDCCAEGELDIISMSTNMAAFEKVIGEGEFAELYTFSDADKAFNISDLNENIIRLCETNGNLFEMPVSFSADFCSAQVNISEMRNGMSTRQSSFAGICRIMSLLRVRIRLILSIIT